MYPAFSTVSYISRLFFWWIGPLIKTGYQRGLEDDDVFDVDARSHAGDLADRFWDLKQSRSTWKALWVMFRRDILISGFFFLVSVALRFTGPLLLGIIVTFITQSQSNTQTDISIGTAFGLAVCLFLAQVIGSLCSVHADFKAMRLGLNARDALIATTFRHLSLLSNSSRAKTNNGLILSLISNDANVALEFTRFWNQIWTSPFVLIAGITYIHVLVGVSVWAGMSILVIFVPFSYVMGKAQTKYQKLKMVVTDQRVKLSSEALQGIRIVKFNAWENALEGVLSEVRQDELTKLRALEYVKAVTTPFSVAVPNIASVLTFITYVATGNSLDAASTFSVISLFVLIRSPFVTLPLAITMFSRAIVMNNRFDEFFKLERGADQKLLDSIPESMNNNERSLVPVPSTSVVLHPSSIKVSDIEPSVSASNLQDGEKPVNGSTTTIVKDARPNVLMPSGSSVFGMGESTTTLLNLHSQPAAVIAEEGSEFSWDETSAFRLKFVKGVTVKPGEFVAIVGEVGSGKTSALLALLGEMNRLSGHVERHGKAAYCAQEPFILNATLRENVLFNLPMQVERYARAVRLACLDADVENLPGGDETEIGERGVNLSGGQKARVALARALYSGADVLFLDDVLSAVDAHVGKTILEDCLLRMRRKTRILVTNNLHVLRRVDKVMVMVAGQVVEVGSTVELLRNEQGALTHIMREMVREDEDESKHVVIEGQETEHPKLMAQNSEPELFRGQQPPSVESTTERESGIVDPNNKNEEDDDPFADTNVDEMEFKFRQKILDPQKSIAHHLASASAVSAAKLTSTETRVRGKVSNKVLSTYWLSGALGSYFLVFLLLFCFAVAEGVFLAVDSYLATASQTASVDTTNFLIIYSCLTIGAIVGILLRSFSFAVFHLAAVAKIYESASKKMLRLPMTFYWKEPLGRLLNRLSADTNVMDTMLGSSWLWLLLTIVRVLGILVLICIAIPVFAAVLIPLFIIYFLFREVYRRSARDLQRIESVSKSPIMNVLTETLNGTSTIRAYGKVNEWIQNADRRILANTRAKFTVESVAVWLTLYLEFLGALIVLLTSVIIVSAKDSIGSGFAGLAMAYSFNIVVNLNFSVKQAVMTEQQMSAVERLLEYTALPTEPDLDRVHDQQQEEAQPTKLKKKKKNRLSSLPFKSSSSANTKPLEKTSFPQLHEPTPSGSSSLNPWPSRGEVEFRNVFLRYRDDLSFALKDLSFRISAGERCGIVGKTGGGKSSLFVCLLRLVDCSEGQVLFDGVDITTVSKRELRSKVTIVPQDPVVFKGTLRYNLDPFNDRTDAEVWSALKAAHISRIAESSELKLDLLVSDNGSNFSVGERALICMARAILRKSKIVCLDEASSALDSNTDLLIQKTIREHFNDSTLLVIAHRLDTVIDLDSVLVMGDGTMLEKDTAHALLTRPEGSRFATLVEETGPANAQFLRERAAQVVHTKTERPDKAMV